MATKDKNEKICTYISYRQPVEVQRGVTVFGQQSDDFFYNYSDRLECERWNTARDQAAGQIGNRECAAFFELALKLYHDAEVVDLRHIVAGCNLSNGFPWLCFGYVMGESNLVGQERA